MRQIKTNYIALIVFIVVTVFCAAMALRSNTEQLLYVPWQPVENVEVDETTLTVPTWNLFHAGNMWGLVSSAHTLSLTYVPDLTAVTVDHTSTATQVSKVIVAPLASMMNQASADGVNLMLSSAYRSADDQQATYSALQAKYGREYAHEYVANPGESEHQTGFAVDIASVTHGCEIDANACSLDAGGTAWLRANAAKYGFIERYPSGKQSITGVAGEHWHYRYVGVPLAKALDAANMTLDEFVTQVAPGYAK